MFVVKIISLILSLQITFAWSSVEDNYFMEYFEDFSTDVKDQIGSAYFQKREAIEVSDEKRFASIFAPVDLLKTAHYWTRHRGRDKYQTNNPPYNSQFTLYTTRASSLNNIVDNKPKRKREIAENFVRLNEISFSRIKREADKDANLEVLEKPLDKPPSNDTNLSSSTAPPPKVSEAPMDDYANPQLKAPDMRKGDGKRRNVGRQFDRKLLVRFNIYLFFQTYSWNLLATSAALANQNFQASIKLLLTPNLNAWWTFVNAKGTSTTQMTSLKATEVSTICSHVIE